MNLLKYFIVYISIIFSCISSAQVPHLSPEHPKGNSSDQLKALPFYNQACKLYSSGHVQDAKRALRAAINESFALTEAQLFLADIFYEQGIIDSAFLYYNSGIDFVIEQKPHYYFRLFETGISCGQYDKVKHNLKHFKKLYGEKTDLTLYENGYPFHYGHYEKYKAQITELYQPKLWIPKATFEKELETEKVANTNNQNKCFVIEGNHIYEIIHKRRKEKRKKLRGFDHPSTSAFVSYDGDFILFSSYTNDTTSQISYTQKKGRKYGKAVLLPQEINFTSWTSTPYLTKDNSKLYFSAKPEGNKDLFVSEVDLSNNVSKPAVPLKRLNTEKDEVSPFFDEQMNTFYYSSNKLEGFGGYDLYYCNDYETKKSIIFPFNALNMGSPINTHKNEVFFGLIGSNYIIQRNALNMVINIYKPVVDNSIHFEINTH